MIEYYWDLIQEDKKKKTRKEKVYRNIYRIFVLHIYFLPSVYWWINSNESLKIVGIITSTLINLVMLLPILIVTFLILKRYSLEEYKKYLSVAGYIISILVFLFALNMDINTILAINFATILMAFYFVVVKHHLDGELKSSKILYVYMFFALILIVFVSFM